MKIMKKPLLSFILLCVSAALPLQAATQRDHLTGMEADMIRDEQDIERRSAIFIKAVERRLLSLTDPQAAQSKQVQKDMEKWGELPRGSRYELLSDVAKILDEAIVNIVGFSTRAPDSKLLPKAMRRLSEASSRFIQQLTQLRTNSRGPEREVLEQAMEYAQSIIEAANKLPSEPSKN